MKKYRIVVDKTMNHSGNHNGMSGGKGGKGGRKKSGGSPMKKEIDNRCAPSKEYDGISCLSLESLIAMACAYNKMYSDKIELKDDLKLLNPTKYKEYLTKQFETRLSNVCDNQKCWVRQDFYKVMCNESKREVKKNTWRPDGPQGKFTWLNTFNINDVMAQYEEKYKDFKFLGAVPVDFEKVNYGVEGMDFGFADMDLTEMHNKGYKKLGAVFNTDEHDQPGKHWVAGFIDLENGMVCYFDSVADGPDERVRKFLRKCHRTCKEFSGGNVKVRSTNENDIMINTIQHQYGNSECGVYSMNFIIRLLEGESFDSISKSKIKDDVMNKNRDVYFS